VQAISYPSDGKHSHLVLGKNPDASPAFVREISKTWLKFTESTDTIPLPMANGLYKDTAGQFTPINNLTQLPTPIVPRFVTPASKVNYKGKTIGIAVASGASAMSSMALYHYFEKAGATVIFVCPGWIPQWKSGKVYLFSEPPVRPISIAQCTTSFADAGKLNLNLLLVPGGLFSTNGVLRNDGDLPGLIHSVYSKGQAVAMIDSGVEVLMPPDTGIPRTGLTIAADQYSSVDLSDAGYHITHNAIKPAVTPAVLGKSSAVVTGFSGPTLGGLSAFLKAIDSVMVTHAKATPYLRKRFARGPNYKRKAAKVAGAGLQSNTSKKPKAGAAKGGKHKL